MMLIVMLSYALAGLINLFYGHWYEVISAFSRFIVYPITAIIIEVPNIMVMYIIHWQSFKPNPVIYKSTRESHPAEAPIDDRAILYEENGDTDNGSSSDNLTSSDNIDAEGY